VEVDEIYRVPITLFYLEDLSYKEIAQTMELPIGTVMSRLSRGKAQLKEILLRKESPIK
jgi:RNA polymerase sigma-70 factor (ECF subfamily)